MLRCVLLSLVGVLACDGARILAVAPTHAVSHFRMVESLLQLLADRGHHVSVMSFYPKTVSQPNYTDIDLRPVQPRYALDCEPWNLFFDVYELFKYSVESCETIVGSEPVQNLLRSGQTFDLVILEAFACDVMLGFPLFYKAPYIAFSPMALAPWLADWIWDPVEFSYVPDHLCREIGVESFVSRGRRLACQMMLRTLSWWFNTRPSLKMIEKHFGLQIDSLDDVKGNVSAILVNTISTLGGIRPHLPNVVEVGGIHIQPHKPLGKELLEWLENCSAGAVVFSMGSMVKASTLKLEIRDSMISILSKLEECVLWKWEDDIPGLPSNIKIAPWLPQSDVLAHPKVRAFVSHGGFHGLAEAIHCGVPVVGIPLYGDQMTNLQLLQMEGAAIVITLNPYDPVAFESALRNVLRKKSYWENMQRLSRLALDVSRTPLETAIWWTEYVLRHNGAPHLRHKGVNLSWWQYYALDVIVAAVASFCVLYVIIIRASLKMFLSLILKSSGNLSTPR